MAYRDSRLAEERREEQELEREAALASQERRAKAFAISRLLDTLPDELTEAKRSPERLVLILSRLVAFFGDFTHDDWRVSWEECGELVEVAYDQLAALLIPVLAATHTRPTAATGSMPRLIRKLAAMLSFTTFAQMRAAYDALATKVPGYGAACRQAAETEADLSELDDELSDLRARWEGSSAGVAGVLRVVWEGRQLERRIEELTRLKQSSERRLQTLTDHRERMASEFMSSRVDPRLSPYFSRPLPADPPSVDSDFMEYSILLEGFDPPRKVELIKAVRDVTGLGLAAAKLIVDSIPSTVKHSVDEMTAATLISKLEAAGGKVGIQAE